MVILYWLDMTEYSARFMSQFRTGSATEIAAEGDPPSFIDFLIHCTAILASFGPFAWGELGTDE